MLKDGSTQYNPSWIDWVSNKISALPGTSWLYYLGLGVMLIALQTGAAWGEGAVAVGAFVPVYIFLASAIAFILAIIPYFDNRAVSALEAIKPLLKIEKILYQNLRYQFSSLPAFRSILASILTLMLVFITEFISGSPYQIEVLEGYPLSTITLRVVYLVCWWLFGTFIYHTIHHLRLINQIYTRHTKIDLFRMNPLYGFSNLAALTAGSLLMLPYGFLFIHPEMKLTDPVVLSIYLVISSIAIITFLLPQLGIHHLQRVEQNYLLDEIDQRYKSTMYQIHVLIDDGKYDEAVSLRSILGTLEEEKKVVKSFSTWPWQPETLRWLFTAMVLPLLMWLAQYFLGQWLSP
jgi:hypothetical protein